MRGGKPAGVRCVQLTADLRCTLYGLPGRPAVCTSLKPSIGMCGGSADEAMRILAALDHEAAGTVLDDSYLARSGSYRQVEAALALLYVTPEGARWQAGLSLRDRNVPSAPEADGRYGEALIEYGAVLPGESGLRGYAGVPVTRM